MNNRTKKNQTNSKKQNSILRLMRDSRDWMKSKDEFPCINAVPLDENIFEWHCNICPDSGDFKGVIFHLIMYFDEEYPVLPPKVKLCTSIPHPNVFDEWICLDMIKRDGENGYKNNKKYQGWTPAYSVTSILMQLESFLFSQSTVDQMNHGGINVDRSFDPVNFRLNYKPKIEKFVCDKCKHCYTKPFPVTLSISRQLGLIAKQQELKQKLGVATKNESKDKKNNSNNNNNNNNFCLWDGLYHDVEMLIFTFFKLNDLIKLKRVAKRFKHLVNNSKIIQKDSIKCWFHRSLMLETDDYANKKEKKIEMLCLGLGVNPVYFNNNTGAILEGQLFGSPSIRKKIGDLEMIKSIDTTFDLLSSDAFVKFGIRNTVFNDCKFTHFIPLYINEKHGRQAMKRMDEFVLKLWNKSSKQYKCHPWLKLYTIANMMKSLIVSVMQACDNKNGVISMHYSTNVLETYFRLHHTLIGIYFTHKEEISPLLQHQIATFFDQNKKREFRNKRCIPDFGAFLSYITLWEKKKINNKKCSWTDIAFELLDETFIRQSKWVLNAHKGLIDPKYCSLKERILFRWKTNAVSNRLFMFNCFFFRECCKLGNRNRQKISLKEQFNGYNSNFGFPNDDTLAYKFQQFVKKIHHNVSNFEDFFDMIGVEYIGNKRLGLWFIECMNESENRGYHKRHFYVSRYGTTDERERDRERENWIKQQQREREQLEKEKQEKLEKQRRLKQRRLQQVEEARIRQERGKTRSDYSLAVEGIFSFSRVTRGRVVEDNVDPTKMNIAPGSLDFLRACVRLTQSSSEVASLDEMIIDAHDLAPTLNNGKTQLSQLAKDLVGKLFDSFANNEDGTMSRDDLKNYIIYYNVGKNDESVDVKVNRIFDKYSNDKDKNKLLKNELFKFSARNGVAFADVKFDVHYPDRFYDDLTSIPIKKVTNNNNNDHDVLEARYYSDFSLGGIHKRMTKMTNARMRVRGTYIDGTPFEFVQLTQEEKKQRKSMIEKVKGWWLEQKPKQKKRKTVTIKSQVFDGDIKCELRPMVQFWISTIKNGVISDNVNEIEPECDIVRVYVRIVTSKKHGRQIKGFSQMYFDCKGKDCRRDWNFFCSYPESEMDEIIIVHSLNEQNSNELVFYGDFCHTSLCQRFGDKMAKYGISPRVRGLTINGNEFYCCGGYDYIICGKVPTVKCVPNVTKWNRTANEFYSCGGYDYLPHGIWTQPVILVPYVQVQQQVQQQAQQEKSRNVGDAKGEEAQTKEEKEKEKEKEKIRARREHNSRQLIECEKKKDVVAGRSSGEIPRLPPIIRNSHLLSLFKNVARDEIRIPRGKPHGMHNGAIPRRPPIIRNSHLLSLFKNVNKINNEKSKENNGLKNSFDLNFDQDRKNKNCRSSRVTMTDDNLSIVVMNEKQFINRTKKRHHRSKKGKGKDKNTNTSININKK